MGLQPTFSHFHNCVSLVPELSFFFFPNYFQGLKHHQLNNLFSAPAFFVVLVLLLLLFSLKLPFTTKYLPWKHMSINYPLDYSLKIESPGALVFNFSLPSKSPFFTCWLAAIQGYVFKACSSSEPHKEFMVSSSFY